MPLLGKDRQRRYRIRHPETIKQRRADCWQRIKNSPVLLEKYKQDQKKYRESHKEHLHKLNREYYKINKERLCKYNNEKSKERLRLLKENDPDKYAKYLKRMRDAARKSYRLHKDDLTYSFKKDNQARETLINYLGGKCVICGYSANIHALELDHKNGWGNKDRLRLLGSKHGKISRYYIKNLAEAKNNLQVLCANCNRIKTIEEKEFYNRIKCKVISCDAER